MEDGFVPSASQAYNKRMQRARVMDKVVLDLGYQRVADARRYAPAIASHTI
jgi:hypothetical protein